MRSPVRLAPLDGVEADAGGGGEAFIATGREPWLIVEVPSLEKLAGRFVTITYRASLWDPPARPLFRFVQGDTCLAQAIAPAPLEACALWTGRIPRGTDRILVSPTTKLGRFAFRIEAFERRTWSALLASGFRRAPRPARSALLTRLIGWTPEADNNLAWAIGAHPLESFRSWSVPRARTLEIEGLDRARCAWDQARAVVVAIRVETGDEALLERTLASLRRQVAPCWRAIVVGATASARPLADERVSHAATIEDAASRLASGASWFAVLPAGAALRPEAIALVIERCARDPEATMIYGDELVDGQPLLKPGWSPRLAAALPFLGRAVFADPAPFATADVEALLRGADWRIPVGARPEALHRILLSCPPCPRARGAADDFATSPAPAARAAIIILTRDQPDLLQRLVASIRKRSRPGGYHLVIVDNAAPDGSGAAVLRELASTVDATVLSRPGPFNFSALCNEAATVAREDVLVFLNDDMEVLGEGWLERLVARALEPGTGAVGARLTYPDGRLQHVGVLAGMGGSAGHFGAPAPGDDPGWAGRNAVLHEVSAVTGACLAVERRKFEAVGGFDAVHLPVELSDIDLCFKLNARGWQTLVDPAVHLMHEESFSRGGATFRRLSKYGDQRAVFVARWIHVLREDPVFHPAMSLYSYTAALG